MAQELKTWLLLSLAVVAGSFAATATSGCKPNSENSTSGVPVPQSSEPGAASAQGDANQEETQTQSSVSRPEPEIKEPAAAVTVTDAEPSNAAPAASSDTTDTGFAESNGDALASAKSGGDWAQWGGSRLRNNTPQAKGIPAEWKPGKFDRKTGAWDRASSQNIKWVAQLGSQTYGNPIIAGGQVYAGTNNGAGYLKRFPATVDLGCLLCFRESDGQFLWQHSSEKLDTGRVHDWPLQGICCAPFVEKDRLWFVTSRGEVRCLDTNGFHDDEDDGPVQDELARVGAIEQSAEGFKDVLASLDDSQMSAALNKMLADAGEEIQGDVKVEVVSLGKEWALQGEFNGAARTLVAKITGPRISVFKRLGPSDKKDADVVWIFDMMHELQVSQHNMCSCSVTCLGDLLFVNTSNGVDESHIYIPSPDAASFICMNKHTGEVYWTDKSPGANILHGQWSSPTIASLGGVPQVIFAGGDGWCYSFKADAGTNGKPELLWKFDANPKDTEWILGGAGTRNNIIGTPVIYDGYVYLAVGQDPEHGEGDGHLWCIDPNKRGDVSPQLAVKLEGTERIPIPHKRIQAVDAKKGEAAVDNPNSAAVWHYSQFDKNGDGQIDFEEQMHRTIGSVVIQDDRLYIADLSGLFHCLDAKGDGMGGPKVYWSYDMLAQSWGSPLIVDGKVYMGDEDGDVAIFEFGDDSGQPIAEINMGTSVYSTPIVANGVLYISTKDRLFAIANQ
jgi:outer membrane protein assembly factor BamB